MEFPAELKYSKEHEWVSVEDGIATIGVTDHAQDALGDIVYVGDLPEPGDDVDQDDVIGVIESVKATSDLFAPVSGRITAINDALEEAPETINEAPYAAGWIVKLELRDPGELDDLLDAEAYQELIAEDE